MRLQHHPLLRPFALAATAAMIAATLALTFGAGVGLAADYQDGHGNVCEGTFSTGSCEWGSHVTGFANVAMGDEMMPALTSGKFNVALDEGALFANTTGESNIAIGFHALLSNKIGIENVAIGHSALASSTEGNENIATGSGALKFNIAGFGNIASGESALEHNSNAGDNVAIGRFALQNNNGSDNIAIGGEALKANNTGFFNTASGIGALGSNTSGIVNVAIGLNAGKNLTTGNNNIDIANEGVAGEAGTTRIGSESTQTKAFVAGVYKKPITGRACAVKVNSAGQLGCNEEAAASTAVATFASRKAVTSGSCLAYTDIAPAGTGACPAKTTGFSSGTLLAGPTPANGARVTNLFADSNAAVSGTDSVLVAVIDNTTGATLLSCTVNSTTKSSCSNGSESGSAVPGDNIEVKLTATGPSGNEKLWRVTFRF